MQQATQALSPMYALSKLVAFVISPLGTALLAGAVGLFYAARGAKRTACAFGMAALIWAWLWATPAFSNGLCLRLEAGYPPLPLNEVPAAEAAIVIGGAISPPSPMRLFADLHDAADRVWHAARLYHAGKAPVLVLSGGSDPEVTPTTEAQAMQMLLRDLSVPDTAMLREGASRTTRQNAENSAALLKHRGIRRVLLVTSALHMARAVAHFQAAGLAVVPVAIDHTAPLALNDMPAWLPDAGALAESGRAFKEGLGRWLAGA